MRFSANIEMLCKNESFVDRIRTAKASGFDGIEFWSWENKDLRSIGLLCQELGLGISSISGDSCEYALCDDTHSRPYIEYARASFEAAEQIGCSMVVLHSNALDNGVVVDSYEKVPSHRLFLSMAKTLTALSPYAQKAGITCVLEPLNIQVDHPGCLLHSLAEAALVVESVGSPSIRLLYDLYHMQIETGNLIANFDRFQPLIAHIHAADVPGRHEMGTGEINYTTVFSHLRSRGYGNWVAFELSPSESYEKAVKAIMDMK
ncbi:Hydroxypyruvate isomerase [bioreactor metagenome]|uniref:Hydroxypyruvate isomerase n=3 Tax=root TaxID=1 RepID=A0A644YLX1_9ZZZZ